MAFNTLIKNLNYLSRTVLFHEGNFRSNNEKSDKLDFYITDAMQNPRKGDVIDWPYEAIHQPGALRYQNPDVFLQKSRLLNNSNDADKSPLITEYLNKYRNEFISLAMGYLDSSHVVGDYHEYGCFSASTFRMALTHAKLFNLIRANEKMKFLAFDSFMGLPKVSDDLSPNSSWVEGSMSMTENEFIEIIKNHDVYTDRVEVYPGFYNESLNLSLQQKLLGLNRKISLVNIDCDLYESAVDVFNFIAPLIQTGTLLYMDDWYCGYNGDQNKGIPRAFKEFCEKFSVKTERFLNCGWWGVSYIVL